MSRTGLLLGALCAAFVAAVLLADPTFLGAEWLLRDRFTRTLADRRAADPRIVVVGVNEKSIATLAQVGYGRPPYSREVYAAVIDELQRAGAAVVAVDILFAEEDLAHPEGDRALATSLTRMPVVLAAAAGAADAGAFASKLWRIDGPPSAPTTILAPHPAFHDAAGIGTIRIASSLHTSVVHDYPLADRVGDAYVPSLALETSRAFLRLPRRGAWSPDAFTFAERRVPIGDERTFAIRWSRAPKLIDFDKLVAVALAHDDPSSGVGADVVAKFDAQFRGRIVLIGYTAAGLNDLRATPHSPTDAGINIHAHAIANLLAGSFDRAASVPLVAAIMLLVAAAFGGVLHRISSQLVSALLALGVVGAWIGSGFAALAGGVIVPTVAGATSIVLTYVVITVVKFTAEQRQTLMLRTTFGHYVSPQILEHILANPAGVRLGGERRDITILFSDIRGFTSISEASEPEEVVEMLNEYLTRMVEILLEHGGTLDKFIGDAVMGFWNAPAAEPDHARRAVACAIDMIAATAEIRERWEQQGKASIRIGIGINTGDAVAGNIGAEKVFGYTVIGDAVNLASRLESKNKDYGTEIIVSEFTLARMGDEFEAVYLDEVKVKGKERAVRIYEVRGKRSQ